MTRERVDPVDLFNQRLAVASAVDRALLPEATAMTLATVDATGHPSARMVLLKGADERGFVFYTNLTSRKAREISSNPNVALCFHWQPLDEQVRIEGVAVPVSAEEADAYFATRARGSQLGAWASLQSEPIARDGDLEARVAQMEQRFADKPVPRPSHWSGYRVVPSRIEFWNNRPSRLHDRRLFVRDGAGWRMLTLYP